MSDERAGDTIDLVKSNESVPRFVHRKNEREIEANFREYASKRLEEKAKEKEIEINQDQRDAINRLTMTTSIMEAVERYQSQRVEQPATPQQIITTVIIAALSEAACFHSDDKKIPINKFSPIIYLSPIALNILSLTDKGRVRATVVHEVEHAIDDILGIRWTREVNEETEGVLGLLKGAIYRTKIEKSARAQEGKLR